MALEVINEIKAAEDKAQETRRVAAIAAKDAVRLAAEENIKIMEKELALIRQSCSSLVEEAQNAAQAEMEAQKRLRDKECEELKARALKKLDGAAQLCLERILR